MCAMHSGFYQFWGEHQILWSCSVLSPTHSPNVTDTSNREVTHFSCFSFRIERQNLFDLPSLLSRKVNLIKLGYKYMYFAGKRCFLRISSIFCKIIINESLDGGHIPGHSTSIRYIVSLIFVLLIFC